MPRFRKLKRLSAVGQSTPFSSWGETGHFQNQVCVWGGLKPLAVSAWFCRLCLCVFVFLFFFFWGGGGRGWLLFSVPGCLRLLLFPDTSPAKVAGKKQPVAIHFHLLENVLLFSLFLKGYLSLLEHILSFLCPGGETAKRRTVF